MPIEYAKRVQAKAALESTSWHNDMLALSESIILNHAAALTSLRQQLNLSPHGKDNSRWLQEVESFIDQVIEASGCHVRSSPDLLRAVRWTIASATAQFAVPTAPVSRVIENAA